MSRLLGLLVLLCLSVNGLAVAVAAGEPPPLPGICSESDRFGFWVTDGPSINTCDVVQLHAGWYTTPWPAANPPRPAGMRFAQLVRISGDGPFPDRACSACPAWASLRTMIERNPGSLWLIGNEPDRQDYVGAERYAELYHDFYTFLKAEDPSCQVAVGGVVQPTPIRLQYLDLILDAYQDRYGEAMPVDVWNVHNYVLREGATGWGCGLPPGTDPALAIEYGIQDHDNLEYWTEHLTAMRQWMLDRGYRDRPLIISEFGILMPEIYTYDYPRVRAFMLATFDWLTTATESDTGYPADGNRLVQAWNWYSLDDPGFEGFPGWSHLCDPAIPTLTPLGLDFGAYTRNLATPLPNVIDLQPTAVRLGRLQLGDHDLVTATVTAEVYNRGGSTAEAFVVRFERDGLPAGEATIPTVAAGGSGVARVVWPSLAQRSYQVTIEVNPEALIVECDHSNNSLSTPVRIAQPSVYLPLIQRSR